MSWQSGSLLLAIFKLLLAIFLASQGMNVHVVLLITVFSDGDLRMLLVLV